MTTMNGTNMNWNNRVWQTLHSALYNKKSRDHKKQNNTMTYINFLQKKISYKETIYMEVKTRTTSCQGWFWTIYLLDDPKTLWKTTRVNSHFDDRTNSFLVYTFITCLETILWHFNLLCSSEKLSWGKCMLVAKFNFVN